MYKSQLVAGVLTLLIILVVSPIAFAQRMIPGRIVSGADQTVIAGATVILKGTKTGTSTDVNGNFNISAKEGSVLVISGVGIEKKEITVGKELELIIPVTVNSKNLQEVVVTALGVRREKRKLGYALQEVKGESLTTARETNVANQLAGKVAGVTVIGSPSGIGGSARVTIRGERSVDLNKNQPLYVVDGVPISNALTGGSGRNNQEVDFGNGAGFVNPDDIESLTILKGPAASALYGSRAANGVIIIKTKSGKGTKGIGVEFNTNTTLETPLLLPEYQNVYGQGNGNGGNFAFVNGGGAGSTDGTDEGWGPAFNGQNFPQFNSPRTLNGQVIPFTGGDLNAPPGSVITATPWLADKNGLKDFLQTGRTLTNNVALVGSNQSGDFRLSYTNLNQTGIVPNSDLKRNTVSFGGGYNLNTKLTARAFVSYIKSESDNRPSIGYGTESIMYLFNCWLPRSIRVSDLKRLWQPGLEGLKQYNWNYNYHDNPYLSIFENTNGQNVDRIIGNVSINYKFNDWLSVLLRTATDHTNELRQYKRAFSTQRFPFGQYRESDLTGEERNSDFLIAVNKSINKNFDFSGTIGGNQMRQQSRFKEQNAGQLNIPGIYNLTNSRIAVEVSQSDVKKSVNSLYGSAQISFRNYLFLDVTARNDWSSALTLPDALKVFGNEQNSYFYPSAALSAVISDMVKLPDFMSFAKVRASYAQVGNDTDPFTFTQAYNPSNPFGGAQVYGETDRLSNLSLKPEISTALEFGADIRFWNNRVGLDVTFYESRTRNQILGIPLSITSGYNSRAINAGEIKNYGFEAMLNLIPVQSTNFKWSMDINFSTNRSKVVSLTGNLTNFVMASRRVSIEARIGERMGDMYGIAFTRVQNTDKTKPYYDATGQYVGQMVYSNGRPIPTTDRIKLGNYNPDWQAGIYNTFEYKGVKLGFLFDIRHGGKIYSETQTVGREGGIIIETLEGRADGYDTSKAGNGVIGAGVVQNTDGSFSPNSKKVTAREWHTAWTAGRGIAEGVMYSASYVKLREVQIGYTIPDKLFKKTPFHNCAITFVGRNLLVWSEIPHVDPEVMSFSGGTALPGIEYMSIPSSRSYGVNLSLKF
ncbi:MAG: SusC/RagA family TonB-linked outer membrane protein [Chitinophagaceae bacterium]